MSRRTVLTVIASLVALTESAAQLPSPQLTSQPAIANPLSVKPWTAKKHLVVGGVNPFDPMYATPKGGAFDGIGSIFVDIGDPNGLGYLCTGTLLAGGQYMLTAAHCLSDGTNVVAQQTYSVFYPPGTPNSFREIITSNQFFVHPLYTGEVIDAHDIALIKLGSAPSAGILAGAKQLYGGNAVGGNATLVGSGTTGTGATGGTGGGGFTLDDRRTGQNRVDLTWSDPNFGGFFNGFFGNADPNTLVGDFDSGNAANDASCWISSFFVFNNAAYCDLGFGNFETSLGGGDSGGPLLLNGLVAGVASYGLTFGLDPDIDNSLNSTFGEFSGWTSVDYNRAWLDSYIAPRQVVPEPTTFVLMLVGGGSLLLVARRRRHG